MSDLRLSAINVYPVKSAAGLPQTDWEVDPFGLAHDRRWMVVDDALLPRNGTGTLRGLGRGTLPRGAIAGENPYARQRRAARRLPRPAGRDAGRERHL